MINLPEVTLLAVSSIKIPETLSALVRSSLDINFGAIKIITHNSPNDMPDFIQFEYCPHIKDIMDYNNYMVFELTNHVSTDYALVVQPDSWVINPELWRDEWLQYDYIGAPWVIKDDAYICYDTGEHVRVGNGGFSLRSKKILDVPKKYNLPLLEDQGWYNEDGNLCVYHRKRMLEIGIRYAPVDVAAIFSYENPVPENKGVRTFGFHKNYPYFI